MNNNGFFSVTLHYCFHVLSPFGNANLQEIFSPALTKMDLKAGKKLTAKTPKIENRKKNNSAFTQIIV